MEGQLNEVAASIDGMDLFTGGRWFQLRMECVEFLKKEHTGGTVSVVYRHSYFPPVCDGGDGINYRVT